MQFRGVLTVLEVFLGRFEAFFEVFEGFLGYLGVFLGISGVYEVCLLDREKVF
jgi:hypothetical protein